METLLPLAAEIGDRLKRRGETLAVSESSAGGLISAALLAQAGASAYYRGGGVIYTAAAFRGLLGLTREELGDLRSSTEPYAALLAGTIRDRLRADWGICETGAAGPTGNGYGDPAGHTCLAVASAAAVRTRVLRTGISDRPGNMVLFAEAGLTLFLQTLEDVGE